jgi:hypothetical protein
MKSSYNSNILKDTYYQPTSKNLIELINYLRIISGKDLKIGFIRQNIFKIRWRKSEVNIRIRCHLKAAAEYINYLKQNRKRANREEIEIIIADIAEYVGIADPVQETSFIVISTNTLPSTIHYKQAQYLFYKHELPDDSKRNYNSDLLVLYALRLALEKRIHGILGIDYVKKNDNQNVNLSELIDIAKSLKNIEYSDKINWDEIEWINKWLNHFMHRHIRPYPWIIHQTFEVLNSILLPTTYMDGNSKVGSFYAASIVKDLKMLENEIQTKLVERFSKINIEWSSNKELYIRKQK